MLTLPPTSNVLHKGYVNALLIWCHLRAQKKWKWVKALLKHFWSPPSTPGPSRAHPVLLWGLGEPWGGQQLVPGQGLMGMMATPRAWAGGGFPWEPPSALKLQWMLIFSVMCVHRAAGTPRGGAAAQALSPFSSNSFYMEVPVLSWMNNPDYKTPLLIFRHWSRYWKGELWTPAKWAVPAGTWGQEPWDRQEHVCWIGEIPQEMCVCVYT